MSEQCSLQIGIVHTRHRRHLLLLLGRVAVCTVLAAYSRQTFPLTICRSVCLWVCVPVGLSVCQVHCGKTADRIRILFGFVGRTSPGMRQVVGFGNRSTGRGNFGGKYGAPHCNQWGLFTTGNSHYAAARLLQQQLLLLLGRVPICTAKATYSRQTFPVTICPSVCLSSVLWKNVGSDPDAV